MTSRFSLLSAALAIGTLVALPVLAETPSPAASTVPPSGAQVQTSTKTPGGQASADVKADAKTDAHKDKLSKDKKAHEQVAEHPGSATKGGASTGTGSPSEPAKQ